MSLSWYIRNADNKFLATGGFSAWGPCTIGWVERFQDATAFDSAYQAEAVLSYFLTYPKNTGAKPPLEVVDYFTHPEPPADADTASTETAEERAARVRLEEAARLRIRRSWGIKAGTAVLALAVTFLQPDPVDAARRHGHRIGKTHVIPRHARHAPRHRVEPAGLGPIASLFGFISGGASDAATFAERFVGTNPTPHNSFWCADFVNFVERRLGRPGTGSREAKSFLHYGAPVSSPRRGDIVVFNRRGGGHVGYYVSGPPGHPVTVSGNAGGNQVRVGTARLPVIAIRRP